MVKISLSGLESDLVAPALKLLSGVAGPLEDLVIPMIAKEAGAIIGKNVPAELEDVASKLLHAIADAFDNTPAQGTATVDTLPAPPKPAPAAPAGPTTAAAVRES